MIVSLKRERMLLQRAVISIILMSNLKFFIVSRVLLLREQVQLTEKYSMQLEFCARTIEISIVEFDLFLKDAIVEMCDDLVCWVFNILYRIFPFCCLLLSNVSPVMIWLWTINADQRVSNPIEPSLILGFWPLWVHVINFLFRLVCFFLCLIIQLVRQLNIELKIRFNFWFADQNCSKDNQARLVFIRQNDIIFKVVEGLERDLCQRLPDNWLLNFRWWVWVDFFYSFQYFVITVIFVGIWL